MTEIPITEPFGTPEQMIVRFQVFCDRFDLHADKLAGMLGIQKAQARSWLKGRRPVPRKHLTKLQAVLYGQGTAPDRLAWFLLYLSPDSGSYAEWIQALNELEPDLSLMFKRYFTRYYINYHQQQAADTYGVARAKMDATLDREKKRKSDRS